MDLVNYVPSIYENNISKDQKVRLHKNSFGDGYNQVAPNGMNHIEKTYIVSIQSMTKDQKDTLENFLIDRGGYKNFAWTPAGDDSERLWKCELWKFVVVAPNYYACSFTVIEDFALGEDI